jgi:hypothetical protein
MRKPRLRKRMYAVSHKGVGLIAGTMAYSRRGAIEHFIGSLYDWGTYKRQGYRTVEACVKVINRQPVAR